MVSVPLFSSPRVSLTLERQVVETTRKGHINAFKEYAAVSKYLVITVVRSVIYIRQYSLQKYRLLEIYILLTNRIINQ